MRSLAAACVLICGLLAGSGAAAEGPPDQASPTAPPSLADQAPNTWVKRSPVPGGPGSPRLGYEASWDYDPAAGKMIRWGGHDPGGGGPQLTETWAYDVKAGKWEYLQTNNNPPGNCCCRENVQCPLDNKFYRFSYPAFGHGWFWDRSRYLREDSVWTFDLAAKRWTNLRPGKEPALNVGKQLCWDPNHQVFWVYDTKLRVYDPYTNTWSTANPSKEIGKRDYAGMALDPGRNRLILFGDQGRDAPQTWAYDIAADKWIDLQPKGESPPGKGSGPTMVYDSRNDRMIAVVLGTPPAEEAPRPLSTWVYDPGKNEWQKMNPPQEPDPAGNRAQLMRYLPDLNIVILENRAAKEQQVWTYRLANPQPPPVPIYVPEDVQVVTIEGGKAEVSWMPAPKGTDMPGYVVYRGEGDQPWKTGLKEVASVKEPRFSDKDLKPGSVYHYAVTGTVGYGRGGPLCLRVRTQPKLILDSRVDVLARDKVVFSWKASDEKDVVGYVVERAPLRPISGAQKTSYAAQYTDKLPLEAMVERAALGAFERLTPKPIAETSFTDAVDLSKIVEVKDPIWQPYFGKDGLEGNKAYDMTKPGCPFAIYAYRVRAVNRLGVEGGPSPYQITVPNEVENLFAKERAEGGGADLKWDASPHQNIKGYYVFRLNGRGAQWDKDSSVVLLTPEPIKETTFTDKDEEGRGKARQYYVVVVDSLGQQGLASHGAWSRRQYWKHYEPWLPKDGWHQ
ncbi:MAG TPA: fibronectin type III domain-containing protein [Planctomycetota bacterium]|nr:fibronectin type III domain-containing protein [Planctomycetota bacterium]